MTDSEYDLIVRELAASQDRLRQSARDAKFWAEAYQDLKAELARAHKDKTYWKRLYDEKCAIRGDIDRLNEVLNASKQ